MNNITFIGMPGVGKSFLGEKIAKKINYNFIDIDTFIEGKIGHNLQKYLDENGNDAFIKLETDTVFLHTKNIENTIVSPGGSVIYSEKTMRYLRSISRVVYLKDSLISLKNRILNYDNRGTLYYKELGFDRLFYQRSCLYKKYSDFILELPIINNLIDVEKAVAIFLKFYNNGK